MFEPDAAKLNLWKCLSKSTHARSDIPTWQAWRSCFTDTVLDWRPKNFEFNVPWGQRVVGLLGHQFGTSRVRPRSHSNYVHRPQREKHLWRLVAQSTWLAPCRDLIVWFCYRKWGWWFKLIWNITTFGPPIASEKHDERRLVPSALHFFLAFWLLFMDLQTSPIVVAAVLLNLKGDSNLANCFNPPACRRQGVEAGESESFDQLSGALEKHGIMRRQICCHSARISHILCQSI